MLSFLSCVNDELILHSLWDKTNSEQNYLSHDVPDQVMIDFQAAERQRIEEPASEIGLEPLCAMVCEFC